MPAAAVIPSPRAYIKVAAVKKLVVCGGGGGRGEERGGRKARARGPSQLPALVWGAAWGA